MLSSMAQAPRQPLVYVPHGWSPWPFVRIGIGSEAQQADQAHNLRHLSTLPKAAPRALLVISAHWEEKLPTVMTSKAPPMLYDYYGFQPESYQLSWPAPGEPTVAARVRELLGAAGFASGVNAER